MSHRCRRLPVALQLSAWRRLGRGSGDRSGEAGAACPCGTILRTRDGRSKRQRR